MSELPRVDIVLSYVGADDVLIRAAVEAGARGLVAAGFAPGLNTAAQLAAYNDARTQGLVIVQCTRAGSGRVPRVAVAQPAQAVTADNLTPQKARILLMLALTQTTDPSTIQSLFDCY